MVVEDRYYDEILRNSGMPTGADRAVNYPDANFDDAGVSAHVNHRYGNKLRSVSPDHSFASCHMSDKTGRRMMLALVGANRGRMEAWNKGNALAANKVVTAIGVQRTGLVEAPLDGYTPPFSTASGFATGLEPLTGGRGSSGAATTCTTQRTTNSFRGSRSWSSLVPNSTSQRANGNGGRMFCAELDAADQDALLENTMTL